MPVWWSATSTLDVNNLTLSVAKSGNTRAEYCNEPGKLRLTQKCFHRSLNTRCMPCLLNFQPASVSCCIFFELCFWSSVVTRIGGWQNPPKPSTSGLLAAHSLEPDNDVMVILWWRSVGIRLPVELNLRRLSIRLFVFRHRWIHCPLCNLNYFKMTLLWFFLILFRMWRF